jgi:hypothetical protein
VDGGPRSGLARRRRAAVIAAALIMSAALAAPATAQDTCVPPPAGLVHWWPANGDTPDIVGGRHGVPKGDAAFTAGKVGQGFAFDGDGDYVELPGSSGVGTELTVAAWVSTSATTADFQAIVSSTRISFVHLQLSGGGSIVALISDSDGVALPVVPRTPAGVFRHVARSVKSADSRLYVDGVPSTTVVPPGG